MEPIPGLTTVDHLGLTVPDLAEAHQFLTEIIGAEYLYRLGPRAGTGKWMSTHLGVTDETSIRGIRFYRLPGGTVVEVFDYAVSNQVVHPPRNSDVGGHHLAFYVKDLDAAVEYLRSRDVDVMGEPTVSSGGHQGQRWVYFRAPWGLQCELVSYPSGRSVDQDPQPYR